VKINTRLRINTYVSLGTVLFIFLSLAWSTWEALESRRKITMVNKMRNIVFERIILRDDYLLHQELRAISQWQAKSLELRELLGAAPLVFTSEEDRMLVLEARKNFDATFELFSQVMTDRGKKGLSFSEGEERMISHGSLKAYLLRDNIIMLYESTLRAETAEQTRGVLVVLAFIGGGIIAIIFNSMIIGKTLAKRITVLSRGVATIGAGDFDHRIAIEGDDELSALALASNEMASSLKASYISIENLQREVTERIRLENKLKETLIEVQRSNRELEQFAYVASHDLQEPLRMVSSYTQLLAESYKNQLDDKAHKFIHYAVDGAVRMQLLINDLLAYSRIGTKGKPLEPTDAHAVLGEVISNLKMYIDEAKAIITNDELPEVRADDSQLVQLFQNLISNAIKFKGEAVPRVHVSARDEGQEWLFSVRDNGIGIEQEYADKVFVIFQRLHTKEEYPGSGIGLAICKKIVERHGGRIWFESVVGKGTTFYFTLPK
jgi:signal transduction histidine kinase